MSVRDKAQSYIYPLGPLNDFAKFGVEKIFFPQPLAQSLAIFRQFLILLRHTPCPEEALERAAVV